MDVGNVEVVVVILNVVVIMDVDVVYKDFVVFKVVLV